LLTGLIFQANINKSGGIVNGLSHLGHAKEAIRVWRKWQYCQIRQMAI
jgi:hypothetical protein